jgi:hypothetical protein
MPLTKEQLLIPRYKIIAPIPFKEEEDFWRVGEILDRDWGWHGDDDDGFKYHISDYPHLFKNLEWYEDRTPDQMPEYLRYVVDFMGHYGAPLNSIFKVSEYKTWGDALAFYSDQLKGKPLYLAHTLPATEEEYNAFINTTPKPAG